MNDSLYAKLVEIIQNEFPCLISSIQLKRESFLDDDWVSILDVLISVEPQIPSQYDYLCYLDIGYVLRSSNDLISAFNYVLTNSKTNKKSTVCFRSTEKRSLFYSNESSTQDIISESFRPRSQKVIDQNLRFYMHPGYCSIFDRCSIIDSSLCPDELKMMEAENDLSYIKADSIMDVIPLTIIIIQGFYF